MSPARPAPPGDGPALRAEGLTKRFGTRQALAGVDLDAPAGTVLGLLGPNGAGKTTTVRILTTLLRPDAGRAWVAGHEVRTAPEAVRTRLGLSGQYAAVDEKLTGRENLYLVARLYGMGRGPARRRAAELLDRFRLSESADRPSGTYSGGMRRRLDLAGALVARPAVVVLDEPTTGLDPRGRADTWRCVRELVDTGTTVLLTTQYLEEADQLADAIAVIDHGRVIAQGTAAALKSRVGGDRLTLTLPDPATRPAALGLLTPLTPHRPHLNPRTGALTVPTDHGPATLEQALTALRHAAVPLGEVSLAPPTLDDVFLALTGQGTTSPVPGPVTAKEPAWQP
ncbi:ATP-binding cassette domain-containing protein [Streptomyces sp. SID8014]|uniref:ATP-binding cassette domain-containing protein n=1 Tax=Streptomyces sp. SID8014 TaxID=2706097 RepID=UPI0013B7CC81|nr:ATP-binding cassette domain-containing protein [Streptomyces sp. SID8014]NEC16194.1 ATP-binding cassette domain-containing protein [Streptomyces sp. SID8014]